MTEISKTTLAVANTPGLTVARIEAGCELCGTQEDVGYVVLTDEDGRYLKFLCKPCFHAGEWEV